MYPTLKLTAIVKTPPKFWEQNADLPKSQQKSGWSPIKIDDLGLFWTIFGTFLVNLSMTLSKDKENLWPPLPLNILKMHSTPPKNLENGLASP